MPWTVTSFACSDPVVQIPKVRIGGCPAQIIFRDRKRPGRSNHWLHRCHDGTPEDCYKKGDAKAEFAPDYASMLADQVMIGDTLAFEMLLEVCGLGSKDKQ